ncbi:hypothetical protein ACHQ4I_22090 [Nocardia nepalensis]
MATSVASPGLQPMIPNPTMIANNATNSFRIAPECTRIHHWGKVFSGRPPTRRARRPFLCQTNFRRSLWALVDPKIVEREVLSAMLEVDAAVAGEHDGILLICGKGFRGTGFRDTGGWVRDHHAAALAQGRDRPLR